MSLNMIKQVEKNIRIKMRMIKEGKSTPKDSGIGVQFNKLKTLDEPSYESLLNEYKTILNSLK